MPSSIADKAERFVGSTGQDVDAPRLELHAGDARRGPQDGPNDHVTRAGALGMLSVLGALGVHGVVGVLGVLGVLLFLDNLRREGIP